MFVRTTPGLAEGAKKIRFGRRMRVVIVLVVILSAVFGFVAGSLFLGPSVSVTKKNFTPLIAPVSHENGTSRLVVSNTNGGITVSTWSQSYLMINGTVTARGFGSSPDAVTFREMNYGSSPAFEAIFPTGYLFLGVSYSVDIHVFVPALFLFEEVVIRTANGNLQLSGTRAIDFTLIDTNGDVTASNISASTLAWYDTNGSVTLALSTLWYGGSYFVNTTNGNVNLTLPPLASCKITANTTSGTVSALGLGVQLTNHATSVIGSGNALVNITTTNGSITVAGA